MFTVHSIEMMLKWNVYEINATTMLSFNSRLLCPIELSCTWKSHSKWKMRSEKQTNRDEEFTLHIAKLNQMLFYLNAQCSIVISLYGIESNILFKRCPLPVARWSPSWVCCFSHFFSRFLSPKWDLMAQQNIHKVWSSLSAMNVFSAHR